MRNAPGMVKALDEIGRRQLDRLAHTVLDRPSTELSSMARSNPELMHEWIREIETRRDEIAAEATALDTALKRLQDLADQGARSFKA